MKLEWKPRGKRVDTELSTWTVWATTDGRYRVVRSVSKYGLPTRHYATLGLRKILGEHRTRLAAIRRCERHASRRAGIRA